MAHKFASNLSFMFQEAPAIIDRYQLARDAGFKAVESGFPLGYTVEEVVKAKQAADVKQILINVYTGKLFDSNIKSKIQYSNSYEVLYKNTKF